MLLVWSFWSALFLVLSAANHILRDPAHCLLFTPVSDDISEAHADVQHLKWVHKLQLWWCRVCPDIFSWYLCTRSSSGVFFLFSSSNRSRIFSPACNMSFLSDAKKKILSRFQNSWFFKSFCNTVRDPTECNLDVASEPQKVCLARFDRVSSSPSNCLDFLISTAVLLVCLRQFEYWIQYSRLHLYLNALS